MSSPGSESYGKVLKLILVYDIEYIKDITGFVQAIEDGFYLNHPYELPFKFSRTYMFV